MKWWLICTILAALVLAPMSVPAQDLLIPEQMGLEYSFTVGAAFPISNLIRDNAAPIVSVAWYGATGDELGSYATIGLSGNWIGITRNDGEQVNLVPIFLNYKVYGYAAGYRLFTNLGIGLKAATDDIPEMRINNGSSFAWTAGFGIDLTNQFFSQFRFIGGEHPSEDGIATVELGWRF